TKDTKDTKRILLVSLVSSVSFVSFVCMEDGLFTTHSPSICSFHEMRRRRHRCRGIRLQPGVPSRRKTQARRSRRSFRGRVADLTARRGTVQADPIDSGT